MKRFWSKASSLTLLLGLLFGLPGAGLAQEPSKESLPRLPYEGTQTLAGTVPQVDVSCILRSWRILGVVVCMSGLTPHACLYVENAYPSGLIEVERQPLRSYFAELGGFLKSFESLRFFGVSSDHTPVSGDGTLGQYGEAKVYTFIPDVGLGNSDIPLAVPNGAAFQVNYLSELDGFGWRSPLVDLLTSPETVLASKLPCDRFPDLGRCAGTWGSYWPRIGFVNHPSQVMGAYVQALRAGKAASSPLGRIALGAYGAEPRTGHYIQMLRPTYRNCVSIGTPLVKMVEAGAGSPYGAYLFLHYGVFRVCKRCIPVYLAEPTVPK
jgi:hypothetical protein